MGTQTNFLRAPRSGHTIVELIVVIAIVSILAFAAATRFDLAQRTLEGVARSLRSNLQFAQDLAMTQGNTLGFNVIDATHYEIYAGVPGNPILNPLTNTGFIVDISPVQFTLPVSTVPFLKSGAPNIAASVTIQLSDAGGTRTITVQQNTGFVTIGP